MNFTRTFEFYLKIIKACFSRKVENLIKRNNAAGIRRNEIFQARSRKMKMANLNTFDSMWLKFLFLTTIP